MGVSVMKNSPPLVEKIIDCPQCRESHCCLLKEWVIFSHFDGFSATLQVLVQMSVSVMGNPACQFSGCQRPRGRHQLNQIGWRSHHLMTPGHPMPPFAMSN